MSLQKIGFDPNSQSSTPQFGLNETHIAPDGKVWEYAKNEGGCSAGHLCLIDQAGDATKLTTTNAASVGQKVGIANIDMTDEYYGWYYRGCGPSFEAIIANAHSAGALLTTTATDGVAGASGTALDGARAIDAGVTDTRVTIHCPTLLTVGIAAASD